MSLTITQASKTMEKRNDDILLALQANYKAVNKATKSGWCYTCWQEYLAADVTLVTCVAKPWKANNPISQRVAKILVVTMDKTPGLPRLIVTQEYPSPKNWCASLQGREAIWRENTYLILPCGRYWTE